MAITATQYTSNTQLNRAYGLYLDSAASPAAAVLTVGFNPRYVRYVDSTNQVKWEWFYGMANGTSVKRSNGNVGTLNTADVAVTVAQDTAQGTQSQALGSGAYNPAIQKGSYTVTIGAALILQNAQGFYEIRE